MNEAYRNKVKLFFWHEYAFRNIRETQPALVEVVINFKKRIKEKLRNFLPQNLCHYFELLTADKMINELTDIIFEIILSTKLKPWHFQNTYCNIYFLKAQKRMCGMASPCNKLFVFIRSFSIQLADIASSESFMKELVETAQKYGVYATHLDTFDKKTYSQSMLLPEKIFSNTEEALILDIFSQKNALQPSEIFPSLLELVKKETEFTSYFDNNTLEKKYNNMKLLTNLYYYQKMLSDHLEVDEIISDFFNNFYELDIVRMDIFHLTNLLFGLVAYDYMKISNYTSFNRSVYKEIVNKYKIATGSKQLIKKGKNYDWGKYQCCTSCDGCSSTVDGMENCFKNAQRALKETKANIDNSLNNQKKFNSL